MSNTLPVGTLHFRMATAHRYLARFGCQENKAKVPSLKCPIHQPHIPRSGMHAIESIFNNNVSKVRAYATCFCFLHYFRWPYTASLLGALSKIFLEMYYADKSLTIGLCGLTVIS